MFPRIINVKYLKKYAEFRSLSTLNERNSNFRCSETNPANHTADNLAQFYKIPKEDENAIFTHGGLTKTFKTHCKTFNETCLMIRQPALELINMIKNLDYTKPAYKFVLYGVKGSGKSLTLSHVIHYGFKANFLLVHVPWVGNWMRRCKESSNSIIENEDNSIDLNLDAANWLLHFKAQNSLLLEGDKLKVSQEYVWNKREKTEQGAPLRDLIDFGINRIKYASYCTVVLCEEIKKLSRNGVCKTMVVIDGYNAFFYPNTRIFREKKQVVHPSNVTLTKAFLNLTNFDWNNAVILLSVDEIATGSDQDSYLPRFLLGKEGFDHLDPFIPIQIENYTEKEFLSCIEYFKDRKWLQQYYPGIEDELSFTSNSNPYNLLEITAAL